MSRSTRMPPIPSAPGAVAHPAIHQVQPRDARPRDPPLLAVERPPFGRLVGAGHQIGRGRARLGLRDGDGRLVPLEHPGQVPALLRLGAVRDGAPTAPDLPSTTIRAVTPQTRAISSTTRSTSRSEPPDPPYSRGMASPMKPAATRSFTLSQGYSSSASQRAARSRNTPSASERARAPGAPAAPHQLEVHQMWMAWPRAASVASSAASESVGCAWMVWMISSSVASSVRPTANS